MSAVPQVALADDARQLKGRVDRAPKNDNRAPNMLDEVSSLLIDADVEYWCSVKDRATD